MSFNDCSNTDLEKTFDLILMTAVKNRLKQSDIPEKLYIISDMEFDCCEGSADVTVFENAKKKYAKHGFKLPQIIFWNVSSRNRQQPVSRNEEGVILVSGATPQLFSMLKDGKFDPYTFMISVLESERYGKIAA